jgi:KaiC/GvpD/RAD55 family RecA-like ATPase
MISEVKKVSISKVWDNIIKGIIFNILQTLALAALLNIRYQSLNPSYLFIIAILYSIGVYAAFFTVYFLVKPLLKRKIKFVRKDYVLLYLFSIITLYLSIETIPLLKFPNFQYGTILYAFLFLYFLLILYFPILAFYISKSYTKIGFVHKPFFIAGVGLTSIFFFFILILITIQNRIKIEYYFLLILFIQSAFTLLYYARFVIEYPSLLQPKWKALMPFDMVMVAITFTLAFIATSLYFTAQDLEIVFSIPLWAPVIVSIILIPVAALFVYTRTFSQETTLDYWTYIRTEIAAHLGLTLYVLSTSVIVWGFIGFAGKLLYAIFFGLSFLFYVTTALDIRNLTKELNIKVQPRPLTIIKYSISIFLSFFIILFIVLLTKGRITSLDLFLGRYSYYPLTLIGIFFIFYFIFIRRTHKGFEELMERGAITTLSYFAGLSVFITVFIMYSRFSEELLSQFPLFGLVFFGYFAILVSDVYSTTTLRVKEYAEKKDIIDLLNHVAGHFFRTDILEGMWDEVIEAYKGLDPDLEIARFYPPERTFDLSMVNEKAKAAVAVAMLYKMDDAAKEEGAPVVPFDDDVIKEIEPLLGEKILLLPEELSKEFKSDLYYSKLLETTFTRINEAIKPFVPFEDYTSIVKKLTTVDIFFKTLAIDESGVQIKKRIKLTRKEFLEYLRLYIKGLENTFPFNRLLLRETVKSEVQNRLILYGFTQADVLNVVPTGVKELDEVLYGGLIKGTSTLILSEERRAKNDVIFMFISEGLKENEPGIFATSRIASSDLLKAFNRETDPQGRLEIIDLYLSTHTENVVRIPVTKGERHIISTSLIQVKQAVVVAVKKHVKEKHKRIVLDIYTDLSKYQNHKEIINLIVKQIEGFKRWNATSIVTLAPDLSTDELERHFDNVFLLTDVSTIKIKKLYGGKPKKDSLIIWGTYAPMEEPDYSLFYEGTQ